MATGSQMFRPWESPQRATAHSTAHSTAHTTAGTGMETKTSQRSATLQDQRRYDTQIPQPVFVLPTQLQTGSATCHVAQAPVGYIQPATQHNSNLAVRTQHNSQQESAPAMTPPPCEALDQNSSLQSPSSPNDSAYHSISSCSTPSNTSCDISTDTSSHSTPPSGIDTSSQTTPSPGSRPTSGSRSVFSPEATSILDYWYQTHIRHPYATLTEMSILAQQCRISVVQVKKWLANRRSRNRNTLTFNGHLHPRQARRLHRQQTDAALLSQHTGAPLQAYPNGHYPQASSVHYHPYVSPQYQPCAKGESTQVRVPSGHQAEAQYHQRVQGVSNQQHRSFQQQQIPSQQQASFDIGAPQQPLPQQQLVSSAAHHQQLILQQQGSFQQRVSQQPVPSSQQQWSSYEQEVLKQSVPLPQHQQPVSKRQRASRKPRSVPKQQGNARQQSSFPLIAPKPMPVQYMQQLIACGALPIQVMQPFPVTFQ